LIASSHEKVQIHPRIANMPSHSDVAQMLLTSANLTIWPRKPLYLNRNFILWTPFDLIKTMMKAKQFNSESLLCKLPKLKDFDDKYRHIPLVLICF
jgi:hypothetical protein